MIGEAFNHIAEELTGPASEERDIILSPYKAVKAQIGLSALTPSGS